ncbi:MAG: response regulator [Chthoniobacteraceae bacterium]
MDSAPRILIVDDNPAIHEDFRKILQDAGTRNVAIEAMESVLFDQPAHSPHETRFALEFAAQGREALGKVEQSIAASRPYALAFVDIRMPPGWDGIETIEHLWKADPALQVVICTAYSDYSWEKMIQRLGVNDNLLILKKPFDNVEVLQLACSMTRKWLMTQRARLRMEQLDAMVAERTTELRRSEERFAVAFQASPIGLAIQSIDEDHFVDVNAAFAALAGCTRDEIIGRTPIELRLLIDLGEDGANSQRERSARLSVRGSEPRHVLVATERITLGGAPHALLIVQDVSERVQLESRLRQSQKMEAVGQLAAGVAHDFNNLLTIIEGHASLQLASGNLPPDAVQSMEQIEHASERAANLTRQLLTFSRQQVLRPRVLHLNEVIHGLLGMLGRILGERVELVCDFATELPLIHADQTSMEQVVMNLTLNARDAMPGGGRISFSTAERDLPAAAEGLRTGRYVCLRVVDTGVGMSDATRLRIFEPFFTTKDATKGTGMGLATVYGIIRQHDGWIEVASAPGDGATFSAYLPVTDKLPDLTCPPPSQPATPGAHQTVFVVEDDASVRSLVREMLESYAYRVIEAESGDAALARWPQIRDEVELLLTDMVMPGAHNGLELSRRLVADKPTLKVIYTSGYSPDLFSGEIDLAEGRNYLPKPYLTSQLIGIVRQAFEGN